MSFLKKLFKRDEPEEDDGTPIVLDSASIAPRLLRLERALDAVAAEMRRDQSMDNPGWRGRVNEYSQLAGECMQLRRASTIPRRACSTSCSRSGRCSPDRSRPGWRRSAHCRSR